MRRRVLKDLSGGLLLLVIVAGCRSWSGRLSDPGQRGPRAEGDPPHVARAPRVFEPEQARLSGLRAGPPAPGAQLRPTATPRLPTPTTLAPTIVAYQAYRVQPEDTLASIARRGGSSATLLSAYNRLDAPPQPGRELIVPRLQGATSTLPEATLLITRGNTTRPWVALTFDCGRRHPRSHELLDALRAGGGHATFFLTGDWLAQDTALPRRIVEEGHELANHSYTHADFTTLSEAEIGQELSRTEAVLEALTGRTTRPLMRFPYGAYDERALRAVVADGYLPIHWTLDVLDSVGEPKTPAFIVERATATLPGDELRGAIILAHCVDSTIDALPEILRVLTSRGLELRTVSDVLGP